MSASKDVYLVLGGDVFAGRHVVEQLKARGDTVFVFDSTQRHDDVECYSGDICVPGQVFDVIQKTGATCVIHTISPLSIKNRDNLSIFHQVNVEGTKCVIAAAKAAGVRKLIYHSSAGVVFDGRDIVNGDESLPYPKRHFDPYTASRALAEQLIIAANDEGLRTVCIRPTGIFGPWDQEMIVGFYDSWKRGTTHVQLGANKNLTDRTYAGNIAHAILLASDKLSDPVVSEQVAGQTFFITNNDPRLFWDFTRSVWAGFDRIFPDRPKHAPKKPVVIPRALAMLMAYISQFVAWLRGDKDQFFTPYTVTFATATMYFNSAKARRVLGYEPQVGVDEGIERTLTWFKAEHDAGKFK
ncbi:3-beta hydroxysteroid dehydrogenase/isomerase family-domain-containing protein [Mycena polygramma]|nr:3-beta hydroxysteroid dehydrogenase/isomerase family-domain-containing protein [Mycena polygramma]KAJ7672226.1 3-beta hydroxysteroid dehydrogenase/isomerase family-domain-containing protein [Mycena polygramma]